MGIRKTIILLAVVLAATGLVAQKNKFVPEWNIGVGFGPTFSSVGFTPNVSTKNELQYHGGIGVRYISENHLGIIAEINYSQQGWVQQFKENPEYSHSHQLNYVEMPVLTHIYFGNKVRFIFNLGPKISVLMSEKEDMSDALGDYLASGTYPIQNPSYQYYRNAEKRFDYGIMAAMGLEFRSGIGNFALEGRYTFGLGNIYNSSKSDFFSKSSNSVLSVRLSYYVKLF